MSVVNSTAQTVGQPLILECSVTTVRGITSRVDIVWSSDGVESQRINGVNASFVTNSSTVYTTTYTIQLLSTTDDNRVYQCEVVINTSPPVLTTSNITLDITGIVYYVVSQQKYFAYQFVQFQSQMFQ